MVKNHYSLPGRFMAKGTKDPKPVNCYSLPVLVFLYLFSNCFMLLNNGRYWDDWCFYGLEGMKAICIGIGSPFEIPIHELIMRAGPVAPLLYHNIVGMTEIIGIVLFYRSLILLRVKDSHVFALTAFFALLPYNHVKMNICCFIYPLGLMFFLLAVFFFLRAVYGRKVLIRVISLLFFFLGYMFLPSTQVLALAFFLFLAVTQEQNDALSLPDFSQRVVRKLLSWLDFLLVPFVYCGVRLAFLLPTGKYAGHGYREITPGWVLQAPVNLFKVFFYNFVGLWGEVLKPLYSNTGIFEILFICVLVLLYVFLRKYRLEEIQSPRKMFYTGLYFFFAGCLAYVLVGILPQFGTVYTRHQILLKFGTSLIILAGMSLFSSEKVQRGAVAGIIALLVVSNISWQMEYQKSWVKQMALEQAFAKEKLLAENVNFSVVDNEKEYSEFGGNLSQYCYTGILRKIHGTQTRYVINYHDTANDFNGWTPEQLAIWNVRDVKDFSHFRYHVYLDQGSVWLSNTLSLKILYQYYFDKSKLERSLATILRVRVLPYNDKIENYCTDDDKDCPPNYKAGYKGM